MGELKQEIARKLLLRCLLCGERFSVQAIRENRFLAETGICNSCYEGMQKRPDLCFGKKSEKGRAGYDEEVIECQEFCPDRKICKEFVQALSSKRDSKDE